MDSNPVNSQPDPEAALRLLDEREEKARSSGLPPDPSLGLERAALLERLARYPEAHAALQDAATARVEQGMEADPEIYKGIATVLFRMNRYLDSLDAIVQSARQREQLGLPEDWELSKLRGNCYYKLGRNAEALSAYNSAERIKQSEGSDPYPYLPMNRGAVYIAMGRHEDALKEFEDCQAQLEQLGLPGHTGLEMNRGVLFASLQRSEEALAAYERAEKLYREAGQPESVNLSLNRGVALTQLGRIEEAMQQFDRSERLRNERGLEPSYNLMFHRALAHFTAGQRSRAIEEAYRSIAECSRLGIPVPGFMAETLQDWLQPVKDALEADQSEAGKSTSQVSAKRYDAFISYRRKASQGHAMLLHNQLTHSGLEVFRDQDDLSHGSFRDRLVDAVRNSRYMLILLTPGFFERCHDEDDEVRREIRAAVEHGIPMIPIMMQGFAWPAASELPEDIRPVASVNAISFSSEFFTAFVDKLLRWME